MDTTIPNNLANKPAFSLRITSLFLLPFAYKVLLFCTVPQSSFLSAGLDAAQFMNRSIKPIRSLKIYSVELCVFFYQAQSSNISSIFETYSVSQICPKLVPPRGQSEIWVVHLKV